MMRVLPMVEERGVMARIEDLVSLARYEEARELFLIHKEEVPDSIFEVVKNLLCPSEETKDAAKWVLRLKEKETLRKETQRKKFSCALRSILL